MRARSKNLEDVLSSNVYDDGQGGCPLCSLIYETRVQGRSGLEI